MRTREPEAHAAYSESQRGEGKQAPSHSRVARFGRLSRSPSLPPSAVLLNFQPLPVTLSDAWAWLNLPVELVHYV